MTIFSPIFENAILACPLCTSGAEGTTIVAANSAIGFLLVVLLGVLGSLFSFIVYLAKRAKKFAEEDTAV